VRKKYSVIIADPPWSYYGDPNKDQAAGKHYSCMTVSEMLELEWPLANPSVLFVWATGPKLDAAFELGTGLNLHYRGVAFVWVKSRRLPDGRLEPIGAQGVRPSVIKPTTEFVLVFSTKSSGRPLPLFSEKVRQVVMAERGAHSAKPRDVQDRIAELYGADVPKLEMFARQRYPGWDAWGNQLG